MFFENLDSRRPWTEFERSPANRLNLNLGWLCDASFYFVGQKYHDTIKMPWRNMLKGGNIVMLFHEERNQFHKRTCQFVDLKKIIIYLAALGLIFSTQGSDSGLLHWEHCLTHWITREVPKFIYFSQYKIWVFLC